MVLSISQLRSRWRSAEGAERATAALGALVRGESLIDLALGTVDGRLDLRGIDVSRPKATSTARGAVVPFDALAGMVELRDAHLRSLDFSGARLPSLRIFGSTFEDVRFDSAECHDLRVWRTDIEKSSFRGADLRGSALGAWNDGRGNTYTQVDFGNADLRRIGSPAATFVDCDFGHARLDGVDFQSSSFERCRFAGEVREVIFWDHGFDTGKPDPNQMRDVDFSDATLRFVEFRRLDLDRVMLPTSADHLVVHCYRPVLECALQAVGHGDSPAERRARALLQHRLKWCGPNQEVGVFYKGDLGSTGAEAAWLVELLRSCEATCSGPGLSDPLINDPST